jgi:SMI1 / KNR4 family (SUKH-1)
VATVSVQVFLVLQLSCPHLLYSMICSKLRCAVTERLRSIAHACRPGASEAQLDAAEAALGVALPAAVRAMYRVHDGQELPADGVADTTGECQLDSPSMLHGVFGGWVLL